MTALISAIDISVMRGRNRVLRDVDFSISPGEIVTIVGPNGSGKSSLLKALIGAIPTASGILTRAPDLRIGYVPQSLALDPTLPLSVRRFLDLPHRVSNAEAEAVLNITGSAAIASRQMTDLSGGQLQRVMLSRALLARPQLLILDEATQGLDQPGAAAFYQQIEDVRTTQGCAVLMVSHDLHVVMAASDRVICLNGHICCEGHPEQVATAPAYRALFGTGTQGALALYRHAHDHHHDHSHGGACVHEHEEAS
ncbi:metal ABC transporter ATP-binding protein [Gymnodinialimonas ceratoperidinii]|uniref:Metal ABC transporter ATP-binding protein n=1 Tax=Gymnodinialimonas ceratoperidinii TaxID=2856823 RepID=A0A8F6TY85_9RHOB|nr:metal ABC transporter ATP-binding protein [Gymnodinialimonas ceratoperidinii]QXT41112.1 metal ABC transporter ATP-binding protein [Gymnodinialimonas ceratoperidinii]